MKKRTKLELIVFAIVAVLYFFRLFADRNAAADIDAYAGKDLSSGISAEKIIEEGRETYLSEETEASDKTMQAVSDGTGQGGPEETEKTEKTEGTVSDGTWADVDEQGHYTSPGEVALYLQKFGHLPSNFIRKNDAKAAGWDPDEGNLDEVCPGKSIGGDRFGNYERQLPEKKDRKYFECDVNYNSKDGYRGQERIIYSNDGLIYYTGDHYNTFELLYGEP